MLFFFLFSFVFVPSYWHEVYFNASFPPNPVVGCEWWRSLSSLHPLSAYPIPSRHISSKSQVWMMWQWWQIFPLTIPSLPDLVPLSSSCSYSHPSLVPLSSLSHSSLTLSLSHPSFVPLLRCGRRDYDDRRRSERVRCIPSVPERSHSRRTHQAHAASGERSAAHTIVCDIYSLLHLYYYPGINITHIFARIASFVRSLTPSFLHDLPSYPLYPV